jgi:hypothetical protein
MGSGELASWPHLTAQWLMDPSEVQLRSRRAQRKYGQGWLNLLIMQRTRTTLSILISAVLCSSLAMADDAMSDLPTKATERSQITPPGSHPFVLRASVLEETNPANEDYRLRSKNIGSHQTSGAARSRRLTFRRHSSLTERRQASNQLATTIPIGSARLLLQSSNLALP